MDAIPALFAAPLNNLMMKKYNVFGVEMDSLEEMRFSKYRDNNGIAMNTLSKEQRFDISKKWLINYI